MVGEHLAGAGDMAHATIEDAPPMSVVVHPELEEVAQKTPTLRDTKGERMADTDTLGRHPLGEQRVRRAVAVGGFVAEKRDEVADRGKADAEHLGAGRFVPEVINLERREEAARRQGPDRLRVGELP